MATQLCRVGQVEGPFGPAMTWIDGTPKAGTDRPSRAEQRAKHWTVRYMDGSVMHDKRFADRNTAVAFWESLPPYND